MLNKDYVLNELNFFNNILFREDIHKYYIGKYEFPISSTGWVERFTEPFKKDYWASVKAKERGITKAEMIAEWDEIARRATDDIGTPFHRYMECKYSDIPVDIDINANDDLKKLIKMGDSFIDKVEDRLIPLKSEVVVGDMGLAVAGMVDQLFYNTKTGNVEMWDWKTSKKIDKTSYNRKKMKSPFGQLMDCNYYHYSLQLNLYKYLIERNSNLKIAKCRIAQFSILNDTYKIYDCVDIQSLITRNLNIIFNVTS